MSENPMFLRQRLRDRLKKAREAAELTQQEVADTFGWSPSKVIRIENGKIGVSVTDTMALASRYRIAAEEQQELVDLARAARQPSWYAPYKEVMTPALEAYIAYEESATIVRNYERNVVPGLLQTEEYARALLQSLQEDDSVDTSGTSQRHLELRVDLRMKRQKALETPDAQFFFILDEAVLRRVVGSETVMRQQHETLLRLSDLPNVTILYVPFTAGPYPLFRSPYQLFQFGPSDDDLVAYLESPSGEALLSERASLGDRKEPADYLDAFWAVEKRLAKPITREVLLGPED
ncbi:Scr1 family TA system antitoxin-like transcriptional regulator [Streptomyces sp. NPDC050534]|uniref:helix-turn-helix domain-containing protein n=1 Tax=Streptomyces sp. NPDC050534 TaxID=3365625 RepID=UPI00379921F2